MWEFPGDRMVRTWCFHYCGLSSIPGLGTEIPHQAIADNKKKKEEEKKKELEEKENKEVCL